MLAVFCTVGAQAAPSGASTSTIGAIVWVSNTSPYYEAGLRSRDVITVANQKPIKNDTDLYKVLAATTTTQQIAVDGLRMASDPKPNSNGMEPFHVTLPNYLPADVTIGSYGWDWARYLKYYAPDPAKPDPGLRSAYRDFDIHQFASAQVYFTSATAAGQRDPLSLAKLAWLLLRRSGGKQGAVTDQAGELLREAEEKFDPTKGDHETESKLDGIIMVYNQRLGKTNVAGIYGRKAIAAMPELVGNRINYYQMLMGEKTTEAYSQACVQTSTLVSMYPRSAHFLRLNWYAHERISDPKGVIDSAEALIEIDPDDISTRLKLLPVLDELGENYRVTKHCNYILRTAEANLTDQQRADVAYYQAQIDMRRGMPGKAEPLVRRAITLRGNGEEHYLLAKILQDKRKWKAATLEYREAMRKPWTQRSRDTFTELRKRQDLCIDKMWSWQIKDMPPDIKKRQEWLEERKVLRHSFLMRNRYGIRNVLVVIGIFMILAGVLMKIFATNY